MSVFAEKILSEVKLTLRETSDVFDKEIMSYIDTCTTDLHTAGILSYYFDASRIDWEVDPQILQAVRWYCLSVYGLYNTDMEKYAKAYASLKSTLATQNKYTKDFHQDTGEEFQKAVKTIVEEMLVDSFDSFKGGRKGQVLKKQSDEDYDYGWEDDAYGQSIDLSGYQTKVDEALETESKEIVGAINEINSGKLSKEEASEEFVPKATDNAYIPRFAYGVDYLGEVKRIPVGNHREAFSKAYPLPAYFSGTDGTPNSPPQVDNAEVKLWTSDPTLPYHAVNKKYVDDLIFGIEEQLTAINEGGIE